MTHSNKLHFSGVMVFVKRVGVVQGLSVGMTRLNTVGKIFSLSIKMLFIIFTFLHFDFIFCLTPPARYSQFRDPGVNYYTLN